MKFVSWNVNGFRSVLKKGFMDWLEAADPDVLNLQEIRCEWEEIDRDVRKQMESAYDICRPIEAIRQRLIEDGHLIEP